MPLGVTRAAVPLAAPSAAAIDPTIEKMVDLMPDYSVGQRLHTLYVNKLQGALPGTFSQRSGTGAAFQGIFFPGWQPDPLLGVLGYAGLDDAWWADFSVAVLCQAIAEQAGTIRGQILTDQVAADVASHNTTLRSHSAKVYAAVLMLDYQPFVTLLRGVDRTTAKQDFHDTLVANVLTRQLWYQAGAWTSPAWEMFNQYAKYVALGATAGEVDSLITTLVATGLPVPNEVREGAWLSYAEALRDKPDVDHDDIRTACGPAVAASTWPPAPMPGTRGTPSQVSNGNCYEFCATSQPGGRYRHPGGGSCFSGDTQVLDGSGRPVALRELRRGDTVLTPDGVRTAAYVGRPLRGRRSLYRLGGGGPVFAATHPFVNAAEPDDDAPVPDLLSVSHRRLASTVPTLSEDGVGPLEVGSRLLVVAPATPGGPGTPVPSTVTVDEVTEVPASEEDDHLFDVRLEPGVGGPQEFWAGRDQAFYLVSPEYPVIDRAGPAAATIVALVEGLLASGIAAAGWPAPVVDAINQRGNEIFHGALTEALAATPSFGAPEPTDPLEARIDRIFARVATAPADTGAMVACLFDGLLEGLGQWLGSVVALGWRTSTGLAGDVLAITVFDLALAADNPLPADLGARVDVTVGDATTSGSTRMWDHRGRPNTRFHRMFDQLVHAELDVAERVADLTFSVTVADAPIPALHGRAPAAVAESAHAFGSMVLRTAAGARGGEIRFDTRRLSRDAASRELAQSGLWTEAAAIAYADALGVAMVEPTLRRLGALTPA